MKPGPAVKVLARGISILGHPLLLTPMAGLAASRAGSGAGVHVLEILAAGLLSTLLVMGYSVRHVRNGAWAHVDASGMGERRSLNRFLLVVFVTATFAGVALRWPLPVSLALLLSASMVAAAMLAARRCKPSLHLAFALFSTALLYAVSAWAPAAGVLAALAVAWSPGRDCTCDATSPPICGAARSSVPRPGSRSGPACGSGPADGAGRYSGS